ncbi:MAG TPA: thioredoxin domain-containing protein [Candidatus Nanoarchaeia archaeon]|nr:thioredoxin domain-containing protein [Candidatus Nanoarchaeia archaeon]
MEEQYSENKNESANESNSHNEQRVRNRVHETKSTGSSTSPDKFWKVTTIVLIVVLGFFAFRSGNLTGGTVAQPTVVDNGGLPAPTPIVDMAGLVTSDDHVKGDKDAPVTIVEWSDFECPFCARFYTETLGLINEQYIKTGKVKLVYKDFPLSFHPNAQKAAEAAECAADQGKFWEMHDLLFERGVAGGTASFKAYAKELDLKASDFDSCLDSGKTASEIQADMALGGQSGIQGTPGFVVNGQIISGAQPFTVFQQVIEAALSS